MKTEFTLAQLADPEINGSNEILRNCVHCGFCTATCPTYKLLGDERDSPRGRIYLIQKMLESGEAAPASTVTHIDRCLSCLSCMTTCPSGVHYMHLVDHARKYIEQTHRRPLMDRLLRNILGLILPRPGLFRASLIGAMLARPLRGLFRGRLRAMLDMAPSKMQTPSALDQQVLHKAESGNRKMRVALMTGCAQKVLSPSINDATIRLLRRHDVEIVIPKSSGCCGALTLHMGKDEPAKAYAARNIYAWSKEIDGAGLDAIVINASGCGTTVKDYGHMFAEDAAMAEKATRVAALAVDITELLVRIDLKVRPDLPALNVTYHSACSMQHGQKITEPPKQLLKSAGFTVSDVPEGHICCGSAGTYNLLQPELAGKLRARKIANIESTCPDVISAGNIGCIAQIASGMDVPVVHTVELLDWATGGEKPEQLP